ncbi:hypothetical protein GCM10027448_30860 [Nocardioides dilutus]
MADLDAGRPLPEGVDGFADRGELLRELHGTWSRRLSGRLDLALETDDHDLSESVARAWLGTAEDLPGIRRILDEHADHPAVRHARRIELRTVAVAAGLATFDDPVASSARTGAVLVGSLRDSSLPPVDRASRWTRLRRALLG